MLHGVRSVASILPAGCQASPRNVSQLQKAALVITKSKDSSKASTLLHGFRFDCLASMSIRIHFFGFLVVFAPGSAHAIRRSAVFVALVTCSPVLLALLSLFFGVLSLVSVYVGVWPTTLIFST